MTLRSIAILGTGDMGSGVGSALVEHGLDVLTCLAGRSEESRARAQQAGFRDVPDLETLVSEAGLVLSIMPPEAAPAAAGAAAAAMRAAGKTPPYADCNAISPDTARAIAADIGAAGAIYIDGGIIGSPPGKADLAVRFFVSGADAAIMDVLDGKGIAVRHCGPRIGDASAVKMCYAAVTKGTNTLHTAALMTAELLGVRGLVETEFAHSQPAIYQRMNAAIPRLPVDAARWIGEMEEIAHTFEAAGVTPGFHHGARDVYRVLAATPYAAFSRATLDPDLTLDEVVKVFVEYLRAREAAQ